MNPYPITAAPKARRVISDNQNDAPDSDSRPYRNFAAAIVQRALDDLIWPDERADAIDWLEGNTPEPRVPVAWCLRVLELTQEAVLSVAREQLALAELSAANRRDKTSGEDIESLLIQICAQFGIAVDQLTGRGQTQKIIAARRAVTWALLERGWSFYDIGPVLNRSSEAVRFYTKRRGWV